MKKNLLFPLVYLVLLTICVAGVSFSKYQVSACGTDVARVARPVIIIAPQSATLNGNAISNISSGISLSNLQPGDVLVYDFAIQNHDTNGNINEVKLRYNINVSFSSSTLPLSYTLTNGGTAYSGGWVTLAPGSTDSQAYELTVTWDSAQAGPDYTNQNENVQVTVNVEQVDS